MITPETNSIRPRYKFVVCYPSSHTEVKAFATLKAARAFTETMEIEYLPCEKRYLPVISKESIEKYNQRRATAQL